MKRPTCPSSPCRDLRHSTTMSPYSRSRDEAIVSTSSRSVKSESLHDRARNEYGCGRLHRSVMRHTNAEHHGVSSLLIQSCPVAANMFMMMGLLSLPGSSRTPKYLLASLISLSIDQLLFSTRSELPSSFISRIAQHFIVFLTDFSQIVTAWSWGGAKPITTG